MEFLAASLIGGTALLVVVVIASAVLSAVRR